MERRLSDCAFTDMLGHIATKDQKGTSVSFKSSRPAAEETFIYSLDEIEDKQGILWQLFGIRDEELFIVNDMYRFISLASGGKELPKDLANKRLHIGHFD